jgi:hypothetical protein
MAMNPNMTNQLLQSQLAMHAVNDPVRIASLAASLGAPPPIIPPPQQATQIVQAMPTAPDVPTAQAPAPPPPPPPVAPDPAVNPVTGQNAQTAPVAPAAAPTSSAAALPSGYGDTSTAGGVSRGSSFAGESPTGAANPDPTLGTADTGLIDKDTADKLAKAGKILGALAPPKSPEPPPMVHSSLPPQGSYNPAVVADFLTALLGARGGAGGGGGGIGGVSSLGKLIGG